MLPMDQHVAKIVMDRDKERTRLQMGDPVPTRWRPPYARKPLGTRIATSTRARWGAFACRLADFGLWLQRRPRRAPLGSSAARLGGWLTGRVEPQTECG
jgi:hypothetical protein